MHYSTWLVSLHVLAYAVSASQFPLMSYLFSDGCFPDIDQDCDAKGSLYRTDAPEGRDRIRFFLFTRKNRDEPEMLHLCNGRLPLDTHFNPHNKLLVFIPGFLNGLCQLSVIREIKDEWLKKGDFNVMLLDNRRALGLNYFVTLDRIPSIASEIIQVLKNIQSQTNIGNEKIELVGMSVGGQVAGEVGRRFKVHRITGLDPTVVGFPESKATHRRLDRTDASLVDIIHCNGGKHIPYLGILYPAGHADFYVNGGEDQTNCASASWEAAKKFDFIYAIAVATVPSLCSHGQCLYYYMLSINDRFGKFKAWRCDSYKDFEAGACTGNDTTPVVMGHDFGQYFTPELRKRPLPHKYYLDTEDEYPFIKRDGGLPNGRKRHSEAASIQ